MSAETQTALDPITFGVLRHKLDQTIAEAYHTIGRVSGSAIVYEAGDHQEAILTPGGDLVVFGAGCLHWCKSIGAGVRHVVKQQGELDFEDGDQFMMNDTYIAAVHANDIQVLAPVIYEGELIAWAGSASHHNDIGGMDVGSLCVSATEVFQEGFSCAGLKIVEGGKIREDVQDLMRTMTRIPDLNILDLRAKIASNNVIRMRILEMVERYGVETVKALFGDLIDYSERRIRARLAQIPDGSWTAENYIEGIREPWIKVRTTVVKKDDELTFDFTGSSPQSPGSDNCGPVATEGAAIVPFIVSLCHDIPWNEGILRVLDFVLPEKSLVNAEKPAAVSANVPAGANILVLTAAHNAISKMLLSTDESRLEACGNIGASFTVQVVSGLGRDGQFFANLVLDIMAGGMGALPDRDGSDTAQNHWSPKAMIPNVESTELHYPIMFLWRRETTDSSGAGKFRGGMGLESSTIAWGTERIDTVHLGVGDGPRNCLGLAGGYPASNAMAGYRREVDIPNRFFAEGRMPASLEEIGGEENLGPTTGLNQMTSKDVFFGLMSGGGGGYGDPLERDPAAVAQDVVDEVVSGEMAGDVYGVVLDDGGAPDQAATEARRDEIRQDRLRKAGIK
jgi:N-methylhydantoinase B